MGGEFDGSTPSTADRGDGDAGAGFEPILLSSFTQFMIAEAELTLNNDAAAAKTALDLAMQMSFDKVEEVGDDQASATPFAISAVTTGAYIAEVDARWTAAPDASEQLRTNCA